MHRKAFQHIYAVLISPPSLPMRAINVDMVQSGRHYPPPPQHRIGGFAYHYLPPDIGNYSSKNYSNCSNNIPGVSSIPTSSLYSPSPTSPLVRGVCTGVMRNPPTGPPPPPPPYEESARNLGIFTQHRQPLPPPPPFDGDVNTPPILPPRPANLVPTPGDGTERFSKFYFPYFMEQRIKVLRKETEERERRHLQIEREIETSQSSPAKAAMIRKNMAIMESNYIRVRSRIKLGQGSFRRIRLLGKGGFGEVYLVQHVESKRKFAMKVLHRYRINLGNHDAHVMAEREILSISDSPWVTKLHFAFQDVTCLYFIMEYVSRGDLLQLLIKEDIFPHRLAIFYTAEIVEALSYVHSIGFIHRDVKPDNLLIDERGHLKLADFGLCVGPDAGNQLPVVGTPSYASPEAVRGHSIDRASDLWSVGVILYEMVIGRPPFLVETNEPDDPSIVEATKERIRNFDRYLKFSPSFHIDHPHCHSLIRGLLCEKSTRLDANKVRQHPYLSSVRWETLRDDPAPYIPPGEPDSEAPLLSPNNLVVPPPAVPQSPANFGFPFDLNLFGFSFVHFNDCAATQGVSVSSTSGNKSPSSPPSSPHHHHMEFENSPTSAPPSKLASFSPEDAVALRNNYQDL